MSSESPCLTCGACCGYFRVTFYWTECASAGGTVPDNLTRQVGAHLACMQGTQARPTRCHALLGEIGDRVRCTIYPDRSSTCREFQTHEADGQTADACTRARAAYGLPPLPPAQPMEVVA